MWMYVQLPYSERIIAHFKKSIRHYSHFCHLYRETDGSFTITWGINVKSSEVLQPWKLQLQVISTFFGLNNSISFVDLIFSHLYWCFHCVHEATSFSGQSFPLASASMLVNTGGKTLRVWNKNVKHAEMAKHKRATTTLRGTWADLHHILQTICY